MENSFKKAFILLLIVLFPARLAFSAELLPGGDDTCGMLRVNGSENPVGIDASRFRLTWLLPQAFEVDRFQVRAGAVAANLAGGRDLYWDSGIRSGGDCAAVEYAGRPAPPQTRLFWTVRVWPAGSESPTAWAKPAFWETGLGFSEDAWKGSEWIAHVKPTPAGPSLHNELFRHTFPLPGKPVASARLYVGTPGFFQAWVNGKQLSDIPCDPIPSRSLKRIYYRTFDVSELLGEGKQTLGLRLFSGYYSPTCREVEHEFPVVRAVLKIRFEDGSEKVTGTHDGWRVTEDYIRLTHRYSKGPGFGKELWNLDNDPGPWTRYDYDDSEWEQATEVQPPSGRLTGQPPVGHIVREVHSPVSVIPLGVNRMLLDFGRVITGRISGEYTLTQSRINEIRLRYFDHWPEPNRFNQTDQWMAAPLFGGNRGVEVNWKPAFHLRCFRYVELEYGGIRSGRPEWSFVAQETGNLREPVADFSCANDLLNRIHTTGVHTLEALTINGIVTDCPHREKDGWGAELGANLDLLCSHFDAEAFLLRYMIDCRDAAFDDGRLPAFIPWRHGIETSLSGGTYYYGCPIETAWKGYLYYGNPAFIEDNFDFLYDFVEYTMGHVENGIIQPYHFSEGYSSIPQWLEKEDGPQYFLGDWLSPGRKLDSKQANMLFNTAYMIYASKMVKKMALLLDRKEKAAQINEWISLMTEGIMDEYIDENTGKVYNGRQPYPVVVLLADFLPEKLSNKVYNELKRTIIEEDDSHFNTGVAATNWLLHILMREGDVDLALDLLTQEDYPGLGAFLKAGFTTFPERWDYENAISFCHASFGGTAFWFLQALAGIRPDNDDPGLRTVIVAPQFTKRLPWARGSVQSHRGFIESSWKWKDKDTIGYRVTLPMGTAGELRIPEGYQTDYPGMSLQPGTTIITFRKIK